MTREQALENLTEAINNGQTPYELIDELSTDVKDMVELAATILNCAMYNDLECQDELVDRYLRVYGG